MSSNIFIIIFNYPLILLITIILIVIIVFGTLGTISIRFNHFLEVLKRENGNYPEISRIRDSPYPQISVYSVRSFILFF